MKTNKYLLFTFVIFFCFLSLACSTNSSVTEKQNNISTKTETKINIENSTKEKQINIPLSNALARVTKKPFGIKISPDDSPVQPEKFSGFHTGVDFEIFLEEKNIDVEIFSICSGPLLSKQYVNGYGGTAIQKCSINNSEVTILYGHLKLGNINLKLNQNLTKGQKIGILGKGFSQETDGERKHLHLGIHKGEKINLLGYVKDSNLLDEWIDPIAHLNNQ